MSSVDLFDGAFDPTPTPEPPPSKYTERDMLDALHARYAQPSQAGDRYVCAEHVRSRCGFAGWSPNDSSPMRIADFIAQDLWDSTGLLLHGHEVKVSRSDWLSELADPAKAEAIKRFCDRWWLVVPDKSIVRGDLPAGWGLLVLDVNGKLRVAHRAPALDPEPMPATFRGALLRAVAQTARRWAV